MVKGQKYEASSEDQTHYLIAMDLLDLIYMCMYFDTNIYIYIYIYILYACVCILILICIQGAHNKFPAFFCMGTFIDNIHMKL